MIQKLFYLLEELKDNYSDNAVTEILNILQNEVIFEDIFKDRSKAKKAFTGQDARFYSALAKIFVNDMNDFPEMYFLTWEPIIELFDEIEQNTFLYEGIEHWSDGDAYDYINGFIKLYEGSPEIALFHFNRIDHYIASYFVGICYLELENDENAIIEFEFFLSQLSETMSTPEFTDHSGYLVAKWNTLNDLGYLFNRTEEYELAKKNYEKGLEIFGYEEVFDIMGEKNNENQLDDFAIWTNNYVLSLEKTQDIEKCIEVLKFATSKRPNNLHFNKQLTRFEEKRKANSYADYVINKAFKRKQPFNIQSFEITKLLSKEKHLEDMIVEQIKYGFKVFGKDLEIYKDKSIYGRQYYIASVNGILDLLLIDKKNDQLYIVELKRNTAGIEVVEQIQRYIDGLSQQLNRDIKGIICLHAPDESLIQLVGTTENIELYSYNFEFRRLD